MTVKKLYEVIQEAVAVYPEAEVIYNPNTDSFSDHTPVAIEVRKNLLTGEVKVVLSEDE